MSELSTQLYRRLPGKFRTWLKLPRYRRQADRITDLSVEYFPQDLPTKVLLEESQTHFSDLPLETSRQQLSDTVAKNYRRRWGSVWMSLLLAIVIELIKLWLESRTHRQMIRTAQLQQKKGF